MNGGMRFTPEQIRALPLSMQEKIGIAIAYQMAKAVPVAGKEDGNGNNAGKENTEAVAMPV